MADNAVTRRRFMQDTAVQAAAAGLGLGLAATARAAEKSKIPSFNENMEYRRLGKTGLMVSAVCLGGHWKRVDVMKQDFDQNRHDVVSRCLDMGINYVDACAHGEVVAYSKALKGRRDKMYVGCSYYEHETRFEGWRTADKLLEALDTVLKDAQLDYADIWRITCFEPGGEHSFNTACEVVAALEKAKQQGKCRHIGISSHDRRWHKMMIEYFPQIEVILFPYTAASKVAPQESLFDAVKKCDVGVFGIKPFASNSLFKGNSAPDSPDAEEDNRRARLAIRYILCNESITAPIPGLISIQQVDNMAKAVAERRQLDVKERAEIERYSEHVWANLPANYQWLKDWQYV